MIQKTFSHFLSAALLAVFAAVIISGCSSTTTPPTTTTSSNVSPKKGSSYNYSMYKTDSSGTKVALTDTNVVATVVADSLQLFGQSNVYTVFDNGDTAYYTYAANGEWMVYYQSTGIKGVFQSIGDAVFHRWITLGTSSKTSSIVVNNMPDTIMYSGYGIPATINLTSDFIGDENITVGTETLTAHHCKITASATSHFALISPDAIYKNERDIYFVAKIGYSAKATTQEHLPAVAALGKLASGSGTVKVLTSYSLK